MEYPFLNGGVNRVDTIRINVPISSGELRVLTARWKICKLNLEKVRYVMKNVQIGKYGCHGRKVKVP